MDQNHEQETLAILLEFSSRSWAEYQSRVLTSNAPVPEDVIIEWLIGALQAQALFESTPEGVLLYTGGLVLNCCYGPARDGDRQGVVLCVIGCEKALAPHLESAAERAFQPEEVRWNVHIVDEQSVMDSLGPIAEARPSQAVLKKLVHTASDFIHSLETGPSPGSSAPTAPLPGVYSQMDLASSVPAAVGSGWYASSACREPAIEEDVLVYRQWLKQVSPDLNLQSVSPGELAEALARWSAVLDPGQFAVCCLAPETIPGLQACLLQADPPVDQGDAEKMVACWREAHDILSRFGPSSERLEELIAEHQRGTREAAALQNLQDLKQKEAVIEDSLHQARENSMRIGTVSLSSSLAQLRLAHAIARAVRIEQCLTDATLDCLAGGGMMDARSARIRERYLSAARNVEQLSSEFVRRHGNMDALNKVKRLSVELQNVRDEAGKCMAEAGPLSRNCSAAEIQTRLLPLRVNLRKTEAAVRTLQLWQELCTAPLAALAARCVRYPRVFLVPSDNHDICAVARDLGPDIAIIDSTVQPHPWLESARLVLVWREGRLEIRRGRDSQTNRDHLKSFKEALAEFDSSDGDPAHLIPFLSRGHFDVLLAATGRSIP